MPVAAGHPVPEDGHGRDAAGDRDGRPQCGQHGPRAGRALPGQRERRGHRDPRGEAVQRPVQADQRHGPGRIAEQVRAGHDEQAGQQDRPRPQPPGRQRRDARDRGHGGQGQARGPQDRIRGRLAAEPRPPIAQAIASGACSTHSGVAATTTRAATASAAPPRAAAARGGRAWWALAWLAR